MLWSLLPLFTFFPDVSLFYEDLLIFFIHFVWHLPSLYRCAWGFYLQLTTYGTPLALCLQIYCSHIKLWLQLVCHFLAETSIWLTGFFFLFCGFFFYPTRKWIALDSLLWAGGDGAIPVTPGHEVNFKDLFHFHIARRGHKYFEF